MAGSKPTPPRLRGYGPSGALREAAVAEHRADVERAAREAEWLRHAVDELGKLAPQAGEETALAERRAAMMQAEKVAEDLRATHDSVTGPNSPVPPLATAVRRLERRAAQAPALIEPVVKAIDAALNALEEARQHLEHALARRRLRSGRARTHRGAAVRAARRRRANTMCRSTISPRWRSATTPISR